MLREHYPDSLLQAVVFLLLTANVLNLGADLGAMADALDLLLPGPRWLYVVLFAAVCAFMQLVLQYTRYVAVLKWLTPQPVRLSRRGDLWPASLGGISAWPWRYQGSTSAAPA